MTVSTSLNRADYVGNGATTAFPVPFYFPDPTNLQVLSTVILTGVSTILVLNSDYTVAGAGVSTGGTITTTVAPAATVKVTILLNLAFVQNTHYVPNDPFPAASHEAALDYLTLLDKQTEEQVSRAIQIPPGESGTAVTLPPAPARAGMLLGFDSFGVPALITAVAQSATAVALQLVAFISSLAASAGAALVGFIQAGTGAVLRTVQSKLREHVSVMDFGAVGDGVTNDSAAFTAALAAARDGFKLVEVPWTPNGYFLGSTVSFPGHAANALDATSLNYGVRLLGLGGGGLASRPKIFGNIAGFMFDLSGSSIARVCYCDTIENLDISNSAPAGAGVGGVKLGYVWDCTIKDCRIYSNGINIDLGAWTMSSRFVNIRHDGNSTGYTSAISWSNAAVTTAYGSYASLNGDYFSGAWAVKVEGGSAFYCKYVFRGFGDISISGMDMEQCCVLFNLVAEGPYKISGGHIENFDCIYSNDTVVYPSSFSTAGGNGGSGDVMFTTNDTSFTGWRGFTSPVVLRPQQGSGRVLLNLDRTMNKGGPYTVHNMSGAWNAITDMTNGNATPVVLSLKATSPLPDFSTTGWKPNYGAARTAKYIVIDADRAETSGQFRLESWTNRLETEQVVRASLRAGSAVTQTIANGSFYPHVISVPGARPADFVTVTFLNAAGTGGLPNGVISGGGCTVNDVVTINYLNNSGAGATVNGTAYVFVQPHDPTTVD